MRRSRTSPSTCGATTAASTSATPSGSPGSLPRFPPTSCSARPPTATIRSSRDCCGRTCRSRSAAGTATRAGPGTASTSGSGTISARPLYGYEGNWRDIFQNWEALGRSYPGYLGQFIAVFLDARTADGYNPYRITRDGGDWEVPDERDPWSHIGYWGDHQIVYLHRLLESRERCSPGALAAGLGELGYAYAGSRTGSPASATLDDPRESIVFDKALHRTLMARAPRPGRGREAAGRRAGRGPARLAVREAARPAARKLTNLVPDGGTWLNTQRPEWNDANNALAGWGLSVVTVAAMRRYVQLLTDVVPADGDRARVGVGRTAGRARDGDPRRGPR